MTTAVVGALRVVLGLDSASFEQGMTAAQKHLRGVGKQMQAVGQNFAVAGAGLTAAVTAPLIAAGFMASKAATEAADAMGQVESALASMGDASGKTKEQLADLAEGVMRNSLYDDDEILRNVTANLLTFGKVAGKEFDRAQVVVADLATRMNMDLQPATLLVGKALNDPIKGLTAMSRAGIQFSESQKTAIKAMVAAGDVAGAQGIILGELERQFGGAAAAAQNTDPYDKVRDTLNSISEVMGALINQHLAPFLAKVAELGDAFLTLDPQMQSFALVGAVIAAALGPALIAIGAVVGAIGTLATAFAAGGVMAGLGAFAVAAAPFVAAAAAIAAAVYLFRDDLAPIFEAFGKAVMDAVGPMLPGIMDSAKAAFASLGDAIRALMDVVGPILAALMKAFIATFGPVVLTALRVLAAGVGSAFDIIGQALRVVTALLKGDWSGAWNAAGSLLGSVLNGIMRLVEAVFPGITANVRKMVDDVSRWLTGKLFDVLRGVTEKVKWVSDAFFKLYDAVVGHSYVPDMVEGIAAWMAKLDAGMVVPARNATQKTREAFEGLRDDVAAIFEGLMTDTERATREFTQTMATLDRALKAGPNNGGITQQQYDDAARRAQDRYNRDGQERLDPFPDRREAEPLEVPEWLVRFQQHQDDLRRAFEERAREFGDAFGYNMERVLRGDIKGVLADLLNDWVRQMLAQAGSALFKSSGGNPFAAIGSAISNVFGGFKIPGFAGGGSFRVGGSGGIDSKLLSMRLTPGEMVDIRKPGQDRGAGGDTYNFSGNLMTPEFWERIQQGDRAAARVGASQGANLAVGVVRGTFASEQHAQRMMKS